MKIIQWSEVMEKHFEKEIDLSCSWVSQCLHLRNHPEMGLLILISSIQLLRMGGWMNCSFFRNESCLGACVSKLVFQLGQYNFLWTGSYSFWWGCWVKCSSYPLGGWGNVAVCRSACWPCSDSEDRWNTLFLFFPFEFKFFIACRHCTAKIQIFGGFWTFPFSNFKYKMFL